MADVFISYASEDRERAARLADALQAHGWSVWWDRKIIIGEAFDAASERELTNARCIAVLWSKNSIASDWVKNEAAVAAERGVLVPVEIDDVQLPLEFRQQQTAQLFEWSGQASHAGFQALCTRIAATVTGRAGMDAIAAPEVQPLPRRPLALIIIAVIAAIGLGLLAQRSDEEASSDSLAPRVPVTPAGTIELADLAAGTYYGKVLADSPGSSLGDVVVRIAKLDQRTVRVTSDYRPMGTIDVELTRVGEKLLNATGDRTFILDLATTPPTLAYNPHHALAYGGKKRS